MSDILCNYPSCAQAPRGHAGVSRRQLVQISQPAIAQLAEHLTVESCSHQMVPGSIPGGRSFARQLGPKNFWKCHGQQRDVVCVAHLIVNLLWLFVSIHCEFPYMFSRSFSLGSQRCVGGPFLTRLIVHVVKLYIILLGRGRPFF